MKPQGWKTIGPGYVERPVNRIDPFVWRQYVEPHADDEVIRRHPGKFDAGEVACLTGAAVGADKVIGRQIVGTVRSDDMYRDAVVVLVDTGQDVAPTNVRVVSASPLGKHLNKPPLLNGNHEQLGFGHHREIQCKAREH